MALTANTDLNLSGGALTPLPLLAGALPFQGSLLSRSPAGFARPLVAGEPFIGIARRRIMPADAGAANGAQVAEAISGAFYAEIPLTGVLIADAASARRVYATDDGTFAFAGETLVGAVVGVAGANRAQVLLVTADMQAVLAGPITGVKTMAATGAQTLLASDAGKIVIVPNTAALTITLPPAATVAGKTITVKKTTADAAIVTLDGDGAETIDGAATSTVIDAANDTLTIISTGTAWLIIAYKIA
jgi:hypothetical protein